MRGAKEARKRHENRVLYGEDRSDLTNNRPTTERRRPGLQPGPAPGPTRKAIMEVAVGQPGCYLPAVRRSVKLRRRGRNKAAEQPLACAGRVPRAPPRPRSPRRNSRTPSIRPAGRGQPNLHDLPGCLRQAWVARRPLGGGIRLGKFPANLM